MLEIVQRARGAGATVPSWWHSHSWLCVLNSAPLAMAAGMTWTSHVLLPTTHTYRSPSLTVNLLESNYCKDSIGTPLESYSCRKIGERPPRSRIMLASVSELCRIGTYKQSAPNFRIISTCGIIGLKPTLESTLPQKEARALLADWAILL